MAISALALASWVFAPRWPVTAALMFAAAILQAIRLSRWAGDRTWRDWLVLILHIGYAFVPFGFLLMAAAILFPQAVPIGGGIHAWTVGAMGTMTLAVMTRASLGHTGQPLSADWLTQAIYALVIAAAAVRIAAAFVPDFGFILVHSAAALWIAAFWGFAIGYGRLLWQPRAASSSPRQSGPKGGDKSNSWSLPSTPVTRQRRKPELERGWILRAYIRRFGAKALG